MIALAVLGFAFWAAIWGFIGAAVGTPRGHRWAGVWLGVFFGFIGVIVVALLPPTAAVRAVRNREQAELLKDALFPLSASPPASHEKATGGFRRIVPVVTPAIRQELMANAVSLDPSLTDVDDPDAMQRLNKTMSTLEQEYLVRAELGHLLAVQAAETEAIEQARLRAEQDAVQTARREAELVAMTPTRRWFAIHGNQATRYFALAVIIAVLLVLAVLDIGPR